MRAAVLLVTLISACGSPDETGGFELAPGAAGSAGSAGASGGGGGPAAPERCKPPPGTTGSPQTIQELIALLNALPKPTTVACFVESLDRPLTITATDSAFSAQPALSAQSPRVFIKGGDLWSSIVIDGDSSRLIELGQILPGTDRSIKGEIELPLEAKIPLSAPFDRVRSGSGTICGLCHADEQAVSLGGIVPAFASVAFKPRRDMTVPVEALRAEAVRCDASLEPHRCAMLTALFGGGEVVEGVFPDQISTFF